jgi:hypothetical protein
MGDLLMADFVINERRREPRVPPPAQAGDGSPEVPGARVLEVIDLSRHGLRCRLTGPVRPGRTMTLRLPARTGPTVITAMVVRCEVCRVTRQSVQYEAAWAVERGWQT